MRSNQDMQDLRRVLPPETWPSLSELVPICWHNWYHVVSLCGEDPLQARGRGDAVAKGSKAA